MGAIGSGGGRSEGGGKGSGAVGGGGVEGRSGCLSGFGLREGGGVSMMILDRSGVALDPWSVSCAVVRAVRRRKQWYQRIAVIASLHHHIARKSAFHPP